MCASNFPKPSLIKSVLHPSDFSEASRNAFAHALAMALFQETTFTIVHVGGNILAGHEWTKFPSVRSALEQWGLLAKGSPRSAVFDKLAIRVKKVDLQDRNPVSAILEYLRVRLPSKSKSIFLVEKGPYSGQAISVRGIQKRLEYYASITGLKVSCHQL